MSSRKFLPEPYLNYLKVRLNTPDLQVAKSALEDFCEKCRNGYAVYPGHKFSLETIILGVLNADPRDPKIQMWCLNALKFVGSESRSITPVLEQLRANESRLQILAAGTACIYKLSKEPHELIRKSTPVPRNVEYLAAAQIIPPSEIVFSPPTIFIETDPVDIIKTAVLLEGQGKATQNLFHPKFENIALLRELMKHDDTIINQYCYWALVENDRYGFDDITPQISDIFGMPDHVRVWTYRLIANACADAKMARNLLVDCIADPYDKARDSVAKGIRVVYHPKISDLVAEWYFHEKRTFIKETLVSHIAKFSSIDRSYEAIITAEYLNFKQSKKDAILDLVKRTDMHSKLKKLEAEAGQTNFFGDYVLGNKIDLSGANITSSGNLNISGRDSEIAQKIELIPQENQEEVEGYIAEVEHVISALPKEVDEETTLKIEESKEAVKKYKYLPSKENLGKIVENLQWFDEKYKAVKDMEIVDKAKSLGGLILKLLPFTG